MLDNDNDNGQGQTPPTAERQTEPRLLLSEAELWARCVDIVMECDSEEWAIDNLIVLLWNLTHQPILLDGVDLADALIDRLYNETMDCGKHRDEYLATLPEKSYRTSVELSLATAQA